MDEEITHYIDNTGARTDNRDLTTTVVQYENSKHEYVVDTRFALWIVENALENADVPEELYKGHVETLNDLLNGSMEEGEDDA
jgi:hypothetical protein